MSSRLRFYSVLLAAAVSAAACSADPRDASVPGGSVPGASPGTRQDGVLLRGHAVFGHEVRSFLPCGETEALWVAAGSELLGEPGAQSEQFVIIEGSLQPPPTDGFGAEYPGAVAVESILYAFVQEGPGCDFVWDAFHYRARGNEPFWMLEVNDEGVRLVRPSEPDVVWAGVNVTEIPDGWVFEPQLRLERDSRTPYSPQQLDAELTIRREPCRDSMSGAYFGMSAEFRYGAEIFTGCTLVGTASTPEGQSDR